MMEPLLAAAPVLAATLALALLVGQLHARQQRRLDTLEQRLEEAAANRVATLATMLGESLVGRRETDESLLAAFERLAREVERLGADIINRELYRGGTPRHGDAIAAVRDGGDVHALVREHGLPLEEAELLVSLYAGATKARAGVL